MQCNTIVECMTRVEEVLSSNPSAAKKNIPSGPVKTHHQQTLYTRVKYQKLSEGKNRSHFGTLVQHRIRDPVVPFYMSVQALKIVTGAIGKNTTSNTSAPELIPQNLKDENRKSL